MIYWCDNNFSEFTDEWIREVNIWVLSHMAEMNGFKYSQQDLELQLHPEDLLDLADPTETDNQGDDKDWLQRSLILRWYLLHFMNCSNIVQLTCSPLSPLLPF